MLRDAEHLARLLVLTEPLADITMRMGIVQDPSALYLSLDGEFNDDGTATVTQAQLSALTSYHPIAGDRVIAVQKQNGGWVVLGAIGQGLSAADFQYVGRLGSATSLQNGWVNWDSGDTATPLRFKQDADGWVHLSGLIKSGSIATIFTIPLALAPSALLLFDTCSNNASATIGVFPDGTITLNNYGTGGSNSFVSLAGISWLPASIVPAIQDWAFIGSENQPDFTNSWSNYSGVDPRVANAAYCVDSAGWVHLQGTIQAGTLLPAFTLPASLVPDHNGIFSCAAGTGIARVDVTSSGNILPTSYALSGSNVSLSLDGISWLPAASQSLSSSGASDWLLTLNSSFLNSWAVFDVAQTTYAWYRIVKNSLGVCRIGGLVKSGTFGSATALRGPVIPPSWRADFEDVFIAVASGGMARIDITTSGVVNMNAIGAGATNAYVSLDDISWLPN